MSYRLQVPKISVFAAQQMGAIQAALISLVEKEVNSLLKKFSKGCPSQEEIKKIASRRNALLKVLSIFDRRLKPIQDIANSLANTVIVLNPIILLLKNVPVPNTVTTVGVTNNFSDILRILSTFSDDLEDQKRGVDLVISSKGTVQSLINSLLAKLDSNIESCVISNNTSINSSDKINVEGLLEATPNQQSNIEYYKGYKIVIKTDPNSPSIAPRRYAEAQDAVGAIILTGQPSFSSSTQILVDEIKFRIDNKLA